MPQAAGGQMALVTGASAGIGEAFAERLAGDGYDLIVVARRGDRLAALARRLRERCGIAVDPLVADLSQASDLRAVEERIARETALTMLVNNAGHGLRGSFIDADPDELEALLRLHAVVPLRLTRAALPGMLARGRGDVINVSSACIFGAGTDQYCATKYYAEAFSRAVAREVQWTGVRVQALLPGFTRTEFFTSPPRIPPSAWMEPRDVVQASLAGLELGEVVCLPSVEDATVLDRIREAQAALIADGMVGALAQRYVMRPVN